ncbi:sensor histidine kinase [Schlesneria sp. T3-172]|uniref:sensor histidine kinase n=1 Tax=Schlesneria sphaerica TaxID=3373610 RepID=UPI0037C5BB84
MFLTRSIRRKLVIVLSLVFAMLLFLSVAGLSALYAYWSLVDDLQFSREKEPQQTALAAALQGLAEPLIIRLPERVNPLQIPMRPGVYTVVETFNGPLWEERRHKAREEYKEFYRRCSDLSKSDARIRNFFTQPTLYQINDKLIYLEKNSQSVDNPDSRLHQQLLLTVMDLQSLALQIPDLESGIEKTIQASQNELTWRFWLIGCPTAIVVALFFSLIYFCYRWILIPIRKLHEAASRVANGDYSYRLKLRGKDEMVELAEMFNKMTDRFQTDKDKLALEVEQRSRQILRNERLAGIGFFASGISHEINNPLQAIGAAAESLTDRIRDGSLGGQMPPEDRELLSTYLGMIERESTRCQQITSRVLDFARGTNGPKSRQDLTKIVNEVLDMVSHMSKFDNYVINFDRGKSHLLDINPAEMKQVVLNLIANGLEAMEGSGTMTIEIVELVDEVVLSIADQGCGMTAEMIANLYEPFFTEKSNGKGTGLGLSITHRIVRDHGGRIEATSEGRGLGSTFRVHLPRCAKGAQISAA